MTRNLDDVIVLIAGAVVRMTITALLDSLRASRSWGSATIGGIYSLCGYIQVHAVVPPEGPTLGTNQVKIRGRNFLAGATVTFGTNPGTNVVVVNTRTILVDVPAHPTGHVAVTVTNTRGDSATRSNAYRYLSPLITDVAPPDGPTVGGTTITITGERFLQGSQVLVDGAPAQNINVVDAQTITADVPAHEADNVEVKVTIPDGFNSWDVYPNVFTYRPPRITQVQPAEGTSVGGTNITITGADFLNGSTVTVGGVAATNVAFVDAQTITATTPAGPVGPATVRVTIPDPFSSYAQQYNCYTYRAPEVTQIQPIEGPSAGGTDVTITGRWFEANAQVDIGGIAAQNVTVVDAQTITATTQARVPGLCAVSVTGPDAVTGTATNIYTYTPPPTVTNLAPPGGTTSGGTTVVISGHDFENGLSVTLGGVAANVVQVQPNRVTITTPLHARGSVDVVVTNPDMQAGTLTDGFEFRRPVVTAISPATSIFAGGIPATITGDYFATNVDVTIGGCDATNIVRVDEQTVTVTIPAHTIGHAQSTSVRVENTHDQQSGSRQLFTYLPMVVNRITPQIGSHLGNTPLTIDGAGFDPRVTMTIGGRNAVVNYVSPTQFTATTPPLASPASLSVDVVIDNGDGQAPQTLVDDYYYSATLTIAAVVPPSGPTAGGNTVFLYGADFTSATVVRFGNTQAAVTYYSPNELQVTVPAPAAAPLAATPVDVHVADAQGASMTLANGYTYAAPPPTRNAVIYPAGKNFGSIKAIGNNQADTINALRSLHNAGALDDQHVSAANQVDNVAYHKHIAGSAGGLLFVRLQLAPSPVHQILDATLNRGGLTGNNYQCNLIGPIHNYRFWLTEGVWNKSRKAAHRQALAGYFAGAPAIQNAAANAFGLTSIEPPHGPVTGTWSVTIRGLNIPPNVTVTVDGASAGNVARLNATTLTADLPARGAGAGVVDVRVTETATGIFAELPAAFTYEVFALTSLTRAIGSDAGNDTVVLVGTGFEPNATVTIGGALAQNIQVRGPSCITCETSAHAQGTVNVVVTNPSNGATAQLPFDFL